VSVACGADSYRRALGLRGTAKFKTPAAGGRGFRGRARGDTGRELNKGESRNGSARAVFLHRLGEIRDRTYENQLHRASGLNLLLTAITLWNTRYLNRAIAALRETEDVPDHLLAHLSPLGWEHIKLTGDYVWSPADEMTENRHGFRPLRPVPDPALMAALKARTSLGNRPNPMEQRP
jgi:hypothetical protein